MPRAFVLLRPDEHYRLESFVAAFERLGFDTQVGQPRDTELTPDDVCLVWNRTARAQGSLEHCRRDGAALVVAENGYWRKRFALALDGHNGSGRWFVGDDTRLDALEIDFQPERVIPSSKVLIAAQRGIGSPRMASPHQHHVRVAKLLRAHGWQPHVREHPGRHAPQTTLAADLEDAHALVVWSSNCATEALIRGVPVLYEAPCIVTEPACQRFSPTRVGMARIGDRHAAFRRLSWAQWDMDEIADGLDLLLQVHHGRLPACQEGLGL